MKNEVEITNQLLAQIYGAYLGCECKFINHNLMGRIVGIDTTIDRVLLDQIRSPQRTYTDTWDIAEHKDFPLLLTPLSEITDEDAMTVGKLVKPLIFANHPKSWVITRSEHDFLMIESPKNHFSIQLDLVDCMVDIYKDQDAVTSEHPIKPAQYIDYLRFKGYDCGFGPIPSLIEAGIATKKTNNG